MRPDGITGAGNVIEKPHISYYCCKEYLASIFFRKIKSSLVWHMLGTTTPTPHQLSSVGARPFFLCSLSRFFALSALSHDRAPIVSSRSSDFPRVPKNPRIFPLNHPLRFSSSIVLKPTCGPSFSFSFFFNTHKMRSCVVEHSPLAQPARISACRAG